MANSEDSVADSSDSGSEGSGDDLGPQGFLPPKGPGPCGGGHSGFRCLALAPLLGGASLAAWGAGLHVLAGATFRREPWDWMPGNDLRLMIQRDVFSALAFDDWSKVAEKYAGSSRFKDSALIIGDATGERWSMQRGSIGLDDLVPMASQTKIITALAIHRLAARGSSSLRLDSRPSDFIDTWPTAGHAGQVELSHLLAFTTGLEAMGPGEPGCARDDGAGPGDWGACLDEVAGRNFSYAPGTTFQYGPWHLLVAAGMALRAEGRNLTREAWAQLLNETVFAPSGIRDAPAYGAGSSGLEMSARQWQQILHKLMFGGLLPPAALGEFTRDHTARVTASVGSRDYAGQCLAGGWHYTQGHYRACDALSTLEERARFKSGRAYNWSEANAKCGFQDSDPAAGPKNNVQHSGGFYGSYVWMDLPDYYYGVYIQFFDPSQVFDAGVKWMVGATVLVWLVACISCVFTHVHGRRGAREGIAH